MLKLSAFADEISPEPDEQIRVCREIGVTHVELRFVRGINVLDFGKDLRAEVRSKLCDNGLGVVSIASPIGKVKITDPWRDHLERFKIAVDAAHFFETPFIRIFSYYPPDKGGDIGPHREEVVRRMRAKVDYLAANGPGLTLLHENEKGIFGDTGRRCLDLTSAVNSPRFRAAFDFANFVQVGERPQDNWKLLAPYTAHIHVKDAVLADGHIVPAGKGDGGIAQVLPEAYRVGYRGFLSLEPHLAADQQFSGFSGPGLFTVAADALKDLCRNNGVPLAGA